ncbi:hypothetical protein SK128_011506 [Halocaridina rubra]|uniref:Uncharacterized protein n=1 Tax=Halocaridina rubra TaxID=373956 RepID=A0AAN9A0U5_HALRR
MSISYTTDQDLDTKCSRGRTLEQPQAQTVLDNRLAVIIGVSLGILIVAVVVGVVCCCQLCKKKREPVKPENPGVNNQDYLSYRHFSIPGNEANTYEGYTAC